MPVVACVMWALRTDCRLGRRRYVGIRDDSSAPPVEWIGCCARIQSGGMAKVPAEQPRRVTAARSSFRDPMAFLGARFGKLHASLDGCRKEV
jgi:hypothetical protein